MTELLEAYRAYIIGPDGRVRDCIKIDCHDDAEAIRLAKHLVNLHGVELWKLTRFVEKFPAPVR
jgi:hypothetical protein